MSIRLAPPAVPELTTAARPLAVWHTRHPWRVAAAVGLGGVLLTAVGMGVVDTRGLDGAPALLVPAAFVGLSAVLGLLVMRRSRPSMADYGFRRPVGVGRVSWALPLAAVVVIVIATSEIRLVPATLAASTLLAVAVGFNEEIWFRGLLLAALRRLGRRRAVVGASAVFGTLHLTNLLGGGDPTYVGLQFAFACLVGFVLAELVEVTGSLWIGIVWHALYDLVAFSVGDSLTAGALVGIAAMTAVLVVYAAYLWRRLPNGKD